MHEITEGEIPAAADALQQWFISQDIESASAGVVMLHLMARLLVQKSKDLGYLRTGIDLHASLLTVNVIEALRNA